VRVEHAQPGDREPVQAGDASVDRALVGGDDPDVQRGADRAGLPGGGVQQFRPPSVVPGQLDQHGLEPEIVPARADAGSAASARPSNCAASRRGSSLPASTSATSTVAVSAYAATCGRGRHPIPRDGVGELHHGVLADAAQLTVEDAVMDEARSPLW
jgi:hypothetical protein